MSDQSMLCGCVVVADKTQRYLALAATSAHTTILSTTSRTRLTQTYVNNTGSLVKEARYMFPMYDGVSVVEFTCTIGPRVIRGVVRERQEAKRIFDRATARGEAAGLLEQSLSASDVFIAKLGNVPAGEDVKVDVTYLGELEHDAEIDGLRFTIPTAIAPRYGDHAYRDLVSAPEVRVQGKIAVTVDIDLGPGCIVKSVQSPSHPISVSIGTMSASASQDPSPQMASTSLSLGSAELEKDFILQVVATGLGAPAALLEIHPTKAHHRTIMASLVPRFNLPVEKPEIVFICDRSGSMAGGKTMPNLISALNIFLKSLPVGVRFNICSFGWQCTFLWPKSVEYTQETLDEAVRHVETFKADYGGTEMLEPVRKTFEKRIQASNLEVFLLTDGEIWNRDRLFDLINHEVAASKGAIRVFTLGIGWGVSHSLINGVARAGNGFAQVAGQDEKIDKKIVRMLKGALTPHVSDYTLEIKYDKSEQDTAPDSDTAADEFELVERVMDSLTIDDNAEEHEQPAEAEEPGSEEATPPTSLFDPSVKNEHLETKDASEELDSLETNLPPVDAPKYLQTPWPIPALFPFNRTTVYIMLSDETPAREPKSVVVRGTSRHGPLQLEIPITKLGQTSTTLHQLAARKAVQELEQGQGWLRHARDAQGEPLREKWPSKFPQVVKREAVRLGVEHQIAGKWCSFVATSSDANEEQETGDDSPAALDEADEAGDDSCASLDDADELSDDGGVSWTWSLQLETVLGITKAEAVSAIEFPIPGDVEDVLATLCAIAHLQKTMAADKDSWELMVDKACSWLQDQVGRIEEELDLLGYNGQVAWMRILMALSVPPY
ncbi:von Willebrand factor A domain-containing protein 5A [Metarhizium anisopliae]|nr:von Willebrand factor A domain-containing protein 5A [Metarhizium anisopliae]